MTKKRGQYQSYQKLISKNEKQLIIKELIKGKQGIIAKIHKKTNIPKSTLCNWKISYDASNIRRGKYCAPGGGAKTLIDYQTEGNSIKSNHYLLLNRNTFQLDPKFTF